MAFYDLNKSERTDVVARIGSDIFSDIVSGKRQTLLQLFSDDDTYIRKSAYLAIGRIFLKNKELTENILAALHGLFKSTKFEVRQTIVNAAGEIGKSDFEIVQSFFDAGLFDAHHAVRNAVIGSVKKMGEVNPKPVLTWAEKYLQHEDKEIRREICHGIELRGRKHPEDILPLLKQLQFDKTARVKSTLVHVLGQIAYKKGCLETVLSNLRSWENTELVKKALSEITDVHHRYRNFSALTQGEAMIQIDTWFPDFERI